MTNSAYPYAAREYDAIGRGPRMVITLDRNVTGPMRSGRPLTGPVRYCRCGTRLARDSRDRLCAACRRQGRHLAEGAPWVPAEFWLTDRMQDALRNWHMGRVIHAYRTHAWHGRPLDQTMVARWAGLTQTQLSRLENGTAPQDLAKLIHWARILDIPTEYLWFKLPGRHTRWGAPSAPDALSRLVSSAADESLRFVDVVAQLPSHADVLDHLRWELGRIAVDYVHAPLSRIVDDLVTTQRGIFELLARRQRPATARELYFLGGVSCLLLAHASQNVGHQRAALAQLHTASKLAHVTNHDALRAWLRGTAALFQEWSQHQDRAVELAYRGGQFSSSSETRIRLAAIEARSAARRGDKAGALDGLARLESAQAGGDGTADDVVSFGGLLSFPTAKQQYYLGSTYGLLGEHELAEHHARAAITAYETGLPAERSYGDEALARLDVANARLAVGDLDGASDAVTPVLTLPAEQRIRQLEAAVVRTRQLLTQPSAARNRATSELRGRLTEYLKAAERARNALPSTE